MTLPRIFFQKKRTIVPKEFKHQNNACIHKGLDEGYSVHSSFFCSIWASIASSVNTPQTTSTKKTEIKGTTTIACYLLQVKTHDLSPKHEKLNTSTAERSNKKQNQEYLQSVCWVLISLLIFQVQLHRLNEKQISKKPVYKFQRKKSTFVKVDITRGTSKTTKLTFVYIYPQKKKYTRINFVFDSIYTSLHY